MSDYRTAFEKEIADLRAKLAAATDGVRDWKNAHALLKEQFHKQRELLEAANQRIEEAEKQEPIRLTDSEWVNIVNHPDVIRWDSMKEEAVHLAVKMTEEKLRLKYTRQIPPADVAELQKEIVRLSEESNRLHQVAVAARQELQHETRKSDVRIAELERDRDEWKESCIDANKRFADAERKLADEQSRLGCIIENHIDDMSWILRELGLLIGDDIPGKFWGTGCRIDRAKVSEELAKLLSEAIRAAGKESKIDFP